MKNIAIITLIIGLFLISIGILLMVVNMFIQNQCFQLAPNNFYRSTICEKYWNDTDWNVFNNIRRQK